jgi:hypothetical protein
VFTVSIVFGLTVFALFACLGRRKNFAPLREKGFAQSWQRRQKYAKLQQSFSVDI